MLELVGITWNHPRGLDPLIATAADFGRRRDVRIRWETRSLQAFGDASVEEMAAEFDFVVIDHPHVGQIAAGDSFLPLDSLGRDDELRALANHSVARSHQSYEYDGRQWALAIDTAAHVSAYRADLLSKPPTAWDEVTSLAREGRVIWPLKPIDSLMSFFSLSANFGLACATDPGCLIEREHGLRVLRFMRDLVPHLPPQCLAMSPPEALDNMSSGDRVCYSPLLFGYSNYSRVGFRPNLITFTNIPISTNGKRAGSILGGTGLAVSSRCAAIPIALDYAFWIASGECQRTLYVQSGGQPAHTAAWEDEQANVDFNGFFRNTRATLDASWIRPRFHGYVDFQTGASTIVHECISGRQSPEQSIEQLQSLFEACVLRAKKI